MIIKIKRTRKEKGEMKKMKKYLSSIYVSENSTPSMVTIAELNYGRTKQHKLRSIWSDHFFQFFKFQSNTQTQRLLTVLFCSVQSNWRWFIQPQPQSYRPHFKASQFIVLYLFILFYSVSLLFNYFIIFILSLFSLYFLFRSTCAFGTLPNAHHSHVPQFLLFE